MSGQSSFVDQIAQHRAYLRILAEAQLAGLRRGRFDPSDLVQQTLIDAWRAENAPSIEAGDQVLAWLRRILANNIANALRDERRLKRDFRREVPLETRLDDSSRRLERWIASTLIRPDHQLERKEMIESVEKALRRLPHDYRQAVVLRHLQGASLDEIAERLGRTQASVAGLIHRGLRRMREILGELPKDE
ncbi:MAG TPA: sigma-70 family RNA polymerase sigma factor [Planctomycetota bacterium]|nr:sigma-70 family RNA polymerase sigma factor [Planctomycetota bacterium]